VEGLSKDSVNRMQNAECGLQKNLGIYFFCDFSAEFADEQLQTEKT